jgi:hypothetical protein
MSDDETDYGIGDHSADADEQAGDATDEQADDATDEPEHGTDEAEHTTDDAEHASEDDHATDHASSDHDERVTSPMQSYTTTHVAWGAVVLAIGLLLTFGLGFAL